MLAGRGGCWRGEVGAGWGMVGAGGERWVQQGGGNRRKTGKNAVGEALVLPSGASHTQWLEVCCLQVALPCGA